MYVNKMNKIGDSYLPCIAMAHSPQVQPNIHSVYAGVKRITNWIFINWARWIGIEYLIVGMIGLSRSE